MAIKQISVFLENTTGRLGEVTGVLARAQINIRAISIADTAEFGILRLIVNDYEAALKALNAKGFTTKVSDVVVVEIDDTPGGLAKVMEIFQNQKVNIEYLYASLEGESGKAVVIFKLENHERGLEIIKEHKLTSVETF